MRRNTHKPAPDGGGEVFDTTIEVPVTIRNPDKPIGTHVFTAMARDDTGLRWTAVTIDSGDDAKDALDRITIPQDVLDRIAPTALPRSSIIISDEPLHKETNYRTEFVVALNDQPQGGLITRKATARREAEGFFAGWGFPSSNPPRRQSDPRQRTIIARGEEIRRVARAGRMARREVERRRGALLHIEPGIAIARIAWSCG